MPPLLSYALLVFVLTVPFWIAGWVFDVSILPGVPLAVFAVIVPSLAAAIVVGRTDGRAAVAALFGRVREVATLPVWGWLGALGVPVGFTLAAWLWHSFSGRAVEFSLPLLAVLPLIAVAIAAAILEEVGWTAFATERSIRAFGMVGGALIIGLGWSVWHYPALVEAHRSLDWIAWWTVWTVGQRVAMVVLYYLTGRNFAVPVLSHATSNVLWQAAPGAFEPMVEALVVALIATALSFALRPKRTRHSP